jgi:non-heme Fe2+,alpha-ketoglutarate-dependent halogenase
MEFNGDRYGLTTREVKDFHERGYHGPFQVIPESDALALNEELKSIRNADENPISSNAFPARDRHRDTESIWNLVSHDKIVHKLRSLYGKHVLLWLTNFPQKPPGGPKLSPHQDPYFFDIRPGNMLSSWTALSDVTEESGGLFFYPGTHRQDYPHIEPEDEDSHPEPMTDPEFYEDVEPVTMDMNPGETILFNSRTVHGSYANTSDINRVALLGRYTLPTDDINLSHQSMYEEAEVTPVSGRNWTELNPTATPPTN